MTASAGHYALLDDPASQTAPGEVRAGLRRFISGRQLVGPVLDLGTGIGGNLVDLRREHQVVGIELSVAAAAQAVTHAPVVVGDGSRLPFRADSFGTVVCTEVLEHVDQPAAVFGEMARVLHPEGIAYVTTPNYANLAGLHKWIADRRSGRHDWNPWGAHDGGYEAFMTGRRLWRDAQQHFDLLAVRGLDFGQAMTGRFRGIDRLATSRLGNAVVRPLLPRLSRSTGRVAWHGMHVELILQVRPRPGGRS